MPKPKKGVFNAYKELFLLYLNNQKIKIILLMLKYQIQINMKKKITVKDLQNFKGKKKLVCILIKNIEEALAADKVGILKCWQQELAGKYKNDDDHA